MLRADYIRSKKYIVSVVVHFVIGTVLFLLLIMTLRSLMNAINRNAFIYQRLDDYPRLYDNFIKENDQWWNWWLTKDYEKRTEQAAFLFDNDRTLKGKSEEDKLLSIADTFEAESAVVVEPDSYDKVVSEMQGDDLHTYNADLSDGRIIMLAFHGSQRESRMDFTDDTSGLMSQLQAGLEGYLLVSHDGEFTIYPQDESSDAVVDMVSSMIDQNRIDPEALKRAAQKDPDDASVKQYFSFGTGSIGAGEYSLYCAAYDNSDDFVINAVRTEDMLRFGRKRSWSLWMLSSSILFLLILTLYNTRLYISSEEEIQNGNYRTVYKRGASVVFISGILLFFAVLFIQLLSGVNQSSKAAQDEAEFLQSFLNRESERAQSIILEFDSMYEKRVESAARVLSDNPQLIDMDSLHSLDKDLDGTSLTVYDPEGNEIASDRMLDRVMEDPEAEDKERLYRAVIVNDKGKTTGIVELGVNSQVLDELLHETAMKDIISEMHMLDALHVVVLDDAEKTNIIASTWSSWVGDTAEEHEIDSKVFFDGYEGIVNYDGNHCYSVVFHYQDYLVAVGSDETTGLVFSSEVLALFIPLFLVMLLVGYFPVSILLYEWQRSNVTDGYADPEEKSEYPQIWRFIHYFMLSVFMLSAVLFFTTNGDPTGLTYNVVRGTWVRGISVVTVTSCIMLVSCVFAFQTVINFFCDRFERYLSPKGKTICRLFASGCAYVGAIVMIIYALTMFGVNTATLVGGVGVTALVFSLGANSLIADVLAGIFIIFDGDFTVDDVVVINDFRGIVIDIGMRTTKLMDDNSKDIMVISNSSISQIINQSQEQSIVTVDVQLDPDINTENGERAIKDALRRIPAMFPKINGKPEYWGTARMPELNPYNNTREGVVLRVAFFCDENDKEMLTYQVQRYFVGIIEDMKEPDTVSEEQSAVGSTNPKGKTSNRR